MGVLATNHPIGDCWECEVLHLRYPLDGGNNGDDELQPGFYVLREVVALSDTGGISYGIVSRAGEDDDGRLVVDGETWMLPRHQLDHFVGIGIRALEAGLFHD